MREVGTGTVWRGRGRSGPGPAPAERLELVRPRAVWRGLPPALQGRVRQTFVRVLLDALGGAPTPREGGRDAPGA
jgi:hypothetical protein